MSTKSWPVQDAKARFSELLDACVSEGPQIVTRRGQEAAVLVAVDEWRRLDRPRTAHSSRCCSPQTRELSYLCPSADGDAGAAGPRSERGVPPRYERRFGAAPAPPQLRRDPLAGGR